MKKKRNIIRNLILFNLLIILTFYFVFRDQNIDEIFSILGTVKIEYVFIAIGCMCVYVLCEAINIGRTLKMLNEESTFIKNIKYALIGFFFSSVTPAASGGQPMQIYYMHKEDISVANSTLALLINLFSMQIVTISLALISAVFNHKILGNGLGWLFLMGILLNASALTLLILAIFSNKSLKRLVDLLVKIMQKLKIKKIEEKQEKLQNQVNKYQESSIVIKQNKKLIIKTILTTYIQFITFYSISYWVYCAFGLAENNIFTITAMQSILFATVSGIPSPGAVGVSEGGFMLIFKNMYGATMVNSAMLLNRGINFYLLVVVSGAVVIFNVLNIKKKLKKNLE